MIKRDKFGRFVKGSHIKTEFKKGQCSGENNPFYGEHHTEETIKKLRQNIPWNKNKKGIYSKKTIRKMSEGKLGDKNPAKRDDVRRNISESKKGNKLSKESIIKRTETRRKNGWLKNSEKTKEKMRINTLEQFKNGMPKSTRKKIGLANSESLKGNVNGFKKGQIPWNRNKKGLQVAWNKNIPNYEIRGDNNPAKRIEVREKIGLAVTGEKNGQWQGGVSFEPYTKEFNNKFKRAIRKRDNQICMLCGIHREKLNKSLFIHHINYDKEMSLPQNCLSLCNSCHTKTNSNRKYWISFFQSLLSGKYGYEYSENQEIIIGQFNERFK